MHVSVSTHMLALTYLIMLNSQLSVILTVHGRLSTGRSTFHCLSLLLEAILYSLQSRGGTYLSVIQSLEVVHISEVKNCINSMVKSIGGTWFVRYIEVVHFSEGPLSEVSLYL